MATPLPGASSHNAKVPALNKFMHPRNPYRTPPSFKLLATQYSEFRKFCTYELDGKVRLDFSQPRALAELAIALLHKDFGLTVKLPDTNLVPTIPLRLNYLLWLQDLVGLWAPRVKHEKEAPFNLQDAIRQQQQQKELFDKEKQIPDTKVLVNVDESHENNHSNKKLERTEYIKPVIGLDIGCGASCVYGLLGAQYCGWHMLASDIDTGSLAHAADNVRNNALQQRILTVKGQPDSLFSVLESPEVVQYLSTVRASDTEDDEPMETDVSYPVDGSGYMLDFCMCNPPFFSSEHDTDSAAKSKKERGPPPNAYTGSLNETVYEGGGEVAFISMMVQESVKYKHKVRLFSSLVGTASDLKRVKQCVAAASPASFTVTEFCQGRTMRWGIAWTWCATLPLRCVVSVKQQQIIAGKPLLLHWPRASCLQTYSVTAAWNALQTWLIQLKIKPKVFKSGKYFIGATLKAYKETWKNQRQQRREEQRRLRAAEGAVSPSGSCSSAVSSMTSPDHHNTTPLVTVNEAKRCLESAQLAGDEDEMASKRPRVDAESSSDEDSDCDVGEGIARNGEGTIGANGNNRNGDVLEVTQSSIDSNKQSLLTKDVPKKATGKPCLLKANLLIKLIDNALVVEMQVQGGLMGREGGNQLMTLFRNKLKKT